MYICKLSLFSLQNSVKSVFPKLLEVYTWLLNSVSFFVNIWLFGKYCFQISVGPPTLGNSQQYDNKTLPFSFLNLAVVDHWSKCNQTMVWHFFCIRASTVVTVVFNKSIGTWENALCQMSYRFLFFVVWVLRIKWCRLLVSIEIIILCCQFVL